MSIDIVTGGAGFIGSHLVDRLLGEGRRVRVLDNFSNGNRANLAMHEGNRDLEVVHLDLADGGAIEGAIPRGARVFHLAALADIVPSIEKPDAYFRSNVLGTFNVVQQALKNDAQRLVYAASSTCYGIPDGVPTPETAEIRPQFPYALTKRMGEELVMHWAQVYQLPALSLRMFNVYGPRARTSGTYGAVFGVFLAQLLAGKPLTIVGDGNQTRDFTYVSDVVDAFVTAASSGVVGKTFNVGSGGTYSVNRIVELLGKPETVHVPRRPGEPDCTWADVTRIEWELGWKAKVSLENGISIMLANIDRWKDAPVWTVENIERATRKWFKYLKPSS